MSRRPPATPDACSQNLYSFIRLRVGELVSDRELARRWRMEWKSFSALKHGRRQVPRLGELEQLGRLLGVDPAFVFEVARGVSAQQVNALLAENDGSKLSELLMAGAHAVRRQAEAARQQYSSVLNRVSDAVFTIDVQGRLQDVNQRLCTLTGFTASELFQRSFFDLLAAPERPGLVEQAASVYQQGEVHGATFSVIAKSGARLVLELGLTRIDDEGGHAIGIQGIAHDVTQRRRLEEQLRQQVATLQMTFDAVPAGCLLFAKDGTILGGNRLVEHVTAHTAAEVVGRKAVEVFGDPGPIGCPVTRAFQTGKLEQQISKVTNKCGDQLYVHRTAGPVFGADGQVDKVVEILVDVSDQLPTGTHQLARLWTGELSTKPDPVVAGREHRKFVRVPHEVPVQLRVGRRRTSAVARNLGRGGIFVHTQMALPVGAETSLDWTLPGGHVVAAKGVVVWAQPQGAGTPAGVGIEFSELTASHRKLIARWIGAGSRPTTRRNTRRVGSRQAFPVRPAKQIE